MKFDGKQLFELGVPKNKIKLYIGLEFESEQDLLEQIKPKESTTIKVFTWVDWIWNTFDHLPMTIKGDSKNGSVERMSKSELKRLLDNKSIVINGKCFHSTQECLDEEFPIQSFVWFPSGSRKTTWL